MKTETQVDIAKIKLENVRLSFPHLFKPHAMEGSEPKFSATFLMDNEKHASLIEKIQKLIDQLALDYWKKKIAFKSCLRNGSEKPDLDGYENSMFLPASRKDRPGIVHRDHTVHVAEEDGVIYAGCYVNATIRLWVQDNKWGKRVNAELQNVQFVKDGESFGAVRSKPEDDFTAVAEGEDDI